MFSTPDGLREYDRIPVDITDEYLRRIDTDQKEWVAVDMERRIESHRQNVTARAIAGGRSAAAGSAASGTVASAESSESSPATKQIISDADNAKFYNEAFLAWDYTKYFGDTCVERSWYMIEVESEHEKHMRAKERRAELIAKIKEKKARARMLKENQEGQESLATKCAVMRNLEEFGRNLTRI